MKMIGILTFLLVYLGLGQSVVLAKEPIPSPKLTVLQCFKLRNAFQTGYLNDRDKLLGAIARRQKEMEGLQYNGIAAWRPSEINEFRRKLAHKHGMHFLATKKIPAYDRTQKLGQATLNIDELFFSQNKISNKSGEYTVIGNAQAIREGTLDPSIFPRLRVWKDVDGNIWTLDHRRLASMRLSGVVDRVNVEFVSEKLVKDQKFKFSTETNGKSLLIEFAEEDPKKSLVAIIDNDQHRLNTKKTNSNLILEKYEPSIKSAWEQARGDQHFSLLYSFSKDYNVKLKQFESSFRDSLIKTFGTIGAVAARAKSTESILAKLVRKDIGQFQKGKPGISTAETAQSSIGDGLGGRIIIQGDEEGKISKVTIQRLVDKLCEDIKKGTRVTEIINYRAKGVNGRPYLSDDQISQIRKADVEYRLTLQNKGEEIPAPMVIRNNPEESMESGYTSLHISIEYPGKMNAEIQVKGKLMHEASETEHLFYDIRQGKPISSELTKHPTIKKAVSAYQSMSGPARREMDKYIEAQLVHARNLELGIPSASPSLPAGFAPELSFESIRPYLIHD